MEPMLGFVDEDEVLGEARIIKVFQMRGSKPFTIGGSAVEDGKFTRNALCRVLRRGKVRGRMLSLDWQASILRDHFQTIFLSTWFLSGSRLNFFFYPTVQPLYRPPKFWPS